MEVAWILLVTIVQKIDIHVVVDYVGVTGDAVATTKGVVAWHYAFATSMTEPAPAAATGGVSGNANVTVTVTLSPILSAVVKPLRTTNV